MRDRIKMKHMIHIDKLTGEGLGAPVELHKTIKGVLPEGLCLLSDSAKSGIG